MHPAAGKELRMEQDLDVGRLLSLAGSKDEGDRAELATEVASLLASRGDEATRNERKLAVDILLRLVQDVSREIRFRIATILAAEARTPREVATVLANDESEIAEPILRNCLSLQDEDLIEVVRHRSIQHMLAVAMRRELSTAVTDVLAERGTPDVIKALLLNEGAAISAATMDYIAEQSRIVTDLQAPLVRRRDLPMEVATRLCEWVSGELKRSIRARFAIDEAHLESAVKQAREQAMKSRGQRVDDSAAALAAEMAKAGKLTTQAVIDALRRGEIGLFEAMLGAKTELDARKVRRLLYSVDGRSLCAAVKHAGMSKQEFGLLYLLIHKSLGTRMSGSELATAMSSYDRISKDQAAAAVAYFRSGEAPPEPAAPKA
jgi:uncharacterized protein (DUF2336 family)